MPDTNYTIGLVQSSGDVAVTVSRNSTTNIVDATSGAPNRLQIPHLMDNARGNAWYTIASATAASPIVASVGTGEGANFASGDLVLVKGGLGDLNINGTFRITVSSDALTLVGSATAGTYTASSAQVVKLNKAKSFHIALASAMAAILNDKAAGN